MASSLSKSTQAAPSKEDTLQHEMYLLKYGQQGKTRQLPNILFWLINPGTTTPPPQPLHSTPPYPTTLPCKRVVLASVKTFMVYAIACWAVVMGLDPSAICVMRMTFILNHPCSCFFPCGGSEFLLSSHI